MAHAGDKGLIVISDAVRIINFVPVEDLAGEDELQVVVGYGVNGLSAFRDGVIHEESERNDHRRAFIYVRFGNVHVPGYPTAAQGPFEVALRILLKATAGCVGCADGHGLAIAPVLHVPGAVGVPQVQEVSFMKGRLK